MATNTEINLADQNWAESFAAKIEAAASAASTTTTETPASDASATATATTDDAATQSDATGASAATTDEGQDTAPAGDATDDPPEPAKSDATDGNEDEQGEKEHDATDMTPTGEFAEAIKRVGVDLTDVRDLPESAQEAVLAKFKQLESGFTKARQRDTAALTEVRAELRFQKDHAADFIAAQIRGDPKLAEAVNALLDEFEQSPTAARAHDVIVERDRAKAREAEADAVAVAVSRAAAEQDKVAALDAHLVAALTKAGVTSGRALERLIASAMDVAEAKTGLRLLTTATVDQIVADYAADVTEKSEHARALEKRRARRQYVADKVTDRQTAGLQVKPGAGTPPAPAAQPTPKTPEEFSAYFAAKLEAQQRQSA